MKYKAIPVATILMSLCWLYMGFFKYGLWYDVGPGGGFMPFLSAALAIAFSIFLLLTPDKEKAVLSRTAFLPLAMALAALVCSMLVGLLAALALMLFLWLWKLERYSLQKSLVITVIPMLVVYGVFRLWLQVPFPTGIFDL